MTFKRTYEILPLVPGHPFYDDKDPLYEVIIKKEEECALLYIPIKSDTNVAEILLQLESAPWEMICIESTFYKKELEKRME